MTEKDVLTAAGLIKARDDAREWIDNIAEDEDAKDYPLVVFDISQRKPDGNGQNWDDSELEIPRELAVAMLRGLEAEAVKQLTALGVAP